jgi:hypothetical protein
VDDVTKWWGSKSAALRLGYGQGHTIVLARQGKLRHVDTEIGMLIDPDSVEQYIRERERKRAEKGARRATWGQLQYEAASSSDAQPHRHEGTHLTMSGSASRAVMRAEDGQAS